MSLSRNSIDYLWELWRKKAGSVMVPGHDIPMKLVDGEPQYLNKREALLQGWFSTTLDDITTISLQG